MRPNPADNLLFPDLSKQTGVRFGSIAPVAHAFRRPLRIQQAVVPVLNLLLLTAGCAVYVIGLNGLLIPHGFLNGGLLGIGLILIHLMPGLSTGLVYLLLNLPLFLLGWIQISRRFVYYTGFGIVCFSFLADIITIPALPVTAPFLAAISAGLVCGIGAGLILMSEGSAGGLDVLSVYLNNRFSIPVGWTGFFTNAVVLAVSSCFFGLEIALYTLIFIFTQSKVIDFILIGFNRRRSLIIISEQPMEVARDIMTHFHRGATLLNGSTPRTDLKTKIVFSVTTITELARVKEIVFKRDRKALMVVNNTLEVVGSNWGANRIIALKKDPWRPNQFKNKQTKPTGIGPFITPRAAMPGLFEKNLIDRRK